MKIRPVGAELFHMHRWTYRWADGRTEMTNQIFIFRNSVKTPKNSEFYV